MERGGAADGTITKMCRELCVCERDCFFCFFVCVCVSVNVRSMELSVDDPKAEGHRVLRPVETKSRWQRLPPSQGGCGGLLPRAAALCGARRSQHSGAEIRTRSLSTLNLFFNFSRLLSSQPSFTVPLNPCLCMSLCCTFTQACTNTQTMCSCHIHR